MHAVFDKTTASNNWTINAKLLKEYMEHFGPKAEQLDISREGERATLMSYTEKLLDGIGRFSRNKSSFLLLIRV